MAAIFRPSTLEDADEILQLMLEVYAAPRDVYFNNRSLFRWKYFAPGPAWVGSRSYVIQTGRRIVAHLGVSPAAFTLHGERITGAALIDWVSSPRAPGLGAVLLRKTLAQSDVAIVAGGSELTRKILPRFGFTHSADLPVLAKPARPWRQFCDRFKGPSTRNIARLARNVAWSGTAPAPRDWSAHRVQRFSAETLIEPEASVAPLRTPEFLNYWLENPVVAAAGFVLKHRGLVRGYFLISRVEHQTRIVDLLIAGTEDDWTAAFAIANRTAIADPNTYEIVAAASAPIIQAALLRCGFRHRRTTPLFLHNPQHRCGSGRLYWNLIDDDAGYIRDPDHLYET